MFLLALFWGTASFGQIISPGQFHKLKQQLADSRNDTSRVRILLALSHAYNTLPDDHFAYKDTALRYARQAGQMSSKYSYEKGVGLSYQEIARYYARHHDAKQSKTYIDQAVEVFTKLDLPREEAEAWLLEEEFYMAGGGTDIKMRIFYYQKAIPLFHRAGAIEREAPALKILADYLQLQNKYVEALELLKQSLALYQKTNVKELQGLYDLLAHVSTQLGDYETGVRYGLAALKTAEAVHDTTLQLCTIYNRLGITYSRLTQYKQSELYYEKALKVALKYNDTETTVQVMLNYADALRRINKPAQALRVMKQCMAKYPMNDKEFQLLTKTTLVAIYLDLNRLADAGATTNDALRMLEAPPAVDGNSEMSVRLAAVKYFIATKQFEIARKHMEIYAQRNNQMRINVGTLTSYKYFYIIDSLEQQYPKALKDYQRYTALKDSIFDLKKSKLIEGLRLLYESDKKQQNIESLERDSKFQHDKTLEANNVRNLTLAGSALLIVLLVVAFVNYRAKQRSNVALNKLVLEKDGLLKEREWLIKEIHHRVKNNLQIVMGLLQRQSAYIDNEAALQAIQNSESRMHSIALIHQKLYQSENLDTINMPEYINELVNFIKDGADTGSRILFEKEVADIDLDVSQAVPLGLILNEAITNAVKYAYPNGEYGVIRVMLKCLGNGEVELLIEDDGSGLKPGFDLEKVNSLGLNLMKGLSKQINGRFEMKHNQGVSIRIIFKVERFSDRARNNINT